jgi:excinuclease UvrABC nuclease subunit
VPRDYVGARLVATPVASRPRLELEQGQVKNKTRVSRWIIATSHNDLPSIPGCYVIYLRGRPFYIGSAQNLRTRFRTHQIEINRIAYKTFEGDPKDVRIKYRPMVKYGDWAMVELRLIRRLQPPLNTRNRKCYTGRP